MKVLKKGNNKLFHLLYSRISLFLLFFSGIWLTVAIEIGKEYLKYKASIDLISKSQILLLFVGNIILSVTAYWIGALLVEQKSEYSDEYASKATKPDPNVFGELYADDSDTHSYFRSLIGMAIIIIVEIVYVLIRFW